MQSAQFQKKLNDILNCQKRFFATFAPVAILLQKYFLLNFLFLLWGPLGVGRRKFLRLPVTGSSLREVLYSMLYIGYKVTGYRNFTNEDFLQGQDKLAWEIGVDETEDKIISESQEEMFMDCKEIMK